MLLIYSEDDSLLVTVAAFLEELRYLFGDELGAIIQHQVPVEILGVVDAVFDLVPVAVYLSLLWSIAFNIAVDVNLDDLVGREEAVANALLQAVGVNRLAEVSDIGGVLRFLGGGGQADLGRIGKVLQDFAPSAVLCCTSTLAFVDHDQVEEARRDLLVELLPFLRASQRLEQANIHLVQIGRA